MLSAVVTMPFMYTWFRLSIDPWAKKEVLTADELLVETISTSISYMTLRKSRKFHISVFLNNKIRIIVYKGLKKTNTYFSFYVYEGGSNRKNLHRHRQ